jgi:hypothetical protein
VNQFGINGDPDIAAVYDFTRDHPGAIIQPQPAEMEMAPGLSNVYGALAFSTSYKHAPPGSGSDDGKASKVSWNATAELFVNLANNSMPLDRRKFIVFGRVLRGMPAVARAASYGRLAEECRPRNATACPGPDSARLYAEGNAYLDSDFPGMDWIATARVLAQPPPPPPPPPLPTPAPPSTPAGAEDASAGCGHPSSPPPYPPGVSTALSSTFGGVLRSWLLYVPPGYDARVPTALVLNTHGWGNSGAEEERDSGVREMAVKHNFLALFPDGLADNSRAPGGGKRSWNCVGSTASPGSKGPTCFAGDRSLCYDSCARRPGGCDAAGCDWTTCAVDCAVDATARGTRGVGGGGATGVGTGGGGTGNATDGFAGFLPALLDWAERRLCVDRSRVFSTGMSNGGMMSYQVLTLHLKRCSHLNWHLREAHSLP